MSHYDWSAHYALAGDLDFSEVVWTTAPVPDFGGKLEGNGFTISKLTIQGGGYLGLFAYLHRQATVANLAVDDVNVVGCEWSRYLGGLAAVNSGLIDNCSISGRLSLADHSQYAGGLVGENSSEGVLSHNIVSCDLFAGDYGIYLGGVAGNSYGTVVETRTVGAISCGNRSQLIGGLVGSTNGSIRASLAAGSILAGDGCDHLGGLSGISDGVVTRSGASGAIFCGNDCTNIGGLIGKQTGDFIESSYAKGDISGGSGCKAMGGLAGAVCVADISNCYATGSISDCEASEYLGGLVGLDDSGYYVRCYATGSIPTAASNQHCAGFTTGGTFVHSMAYHCFWDVETSRQETSTGGTGKDHCRDADRCHLPRRGLGLRR